MSRAISHTHQIVFEKATTGIGMVVPVREFRNIVLQVSTSNSANCTIKFVGAVGKNAAADLISPPSYPDNNPNFGASATIGNPWAYVEAVNLADRTSIYSGSTGLVYTGTDSVQLLELNVNNLNFFTINITAISAGKVSVLFQGTSD